jgi:glycerol-3-phosphate dehydrogenase
MPIVEQIYGVLYEGLDVETAVLALMRRPVAPEHD